MGSVSRLRAFISRRRRLIVAAAVGVFATISLGLVIRASGMPALQVVQVSQGLLTPVIAAIAAYIAWQQWQANRLKLVLDRYDRRLRVYQRVIEFLDLSLRDFKPDAGEIARFRVDVAEADFLFGPDIRDYIADLAKRAVESTIAHGEYRDFTQPVREGYDHTKTVSDMHRHELWFIQQHEVARQRFKPYLDVSQ